MILETRILDCGIASCVGLSVEESAASVRAGIARFHSIAGSDSTEEDMDAAVIGAPIDLLTSGFIQTARWSRLVQHAFEDMLKGEYDELSLDWEKIPVVWCLPYFVNSFGWPEDELDVLLREYLVRPVANYLGIEIFTPANGFFLLGSSGAAYAINMLEKTLDAGGFANGICISVDSLLEPLVLEELSENERLKEAGNPVGLIPGEGASVVLFERSSSSQSSRSVKIKRTVFKDPNIASTHGNWNHEDSIKIGKELCRCVVDVLSGFNKENKFYGNIYLDLNGEQWRSVVWATALVGLKGSAVIDVDKCREIIPATSWGDIGAGSFGAFICLLVESCKRSYGSTNGSLICTVSDSGEVGVSLMGMV